MARMILHTGQSLRHQGHSRQRPQIGTEAVRPCALQQRFLHLLELLAIQLGLASRPTGATQGRSAAPLPFCVPTTHALATDLQFPSDRRVNHPTGLEQTSRLFATVLEFRKIPPRRNRCAHDFSIGWRRVVCHYITRVCHCIMRDSISLQAKARHLAVKCWFRSIGSNPELRNGAGPNA